MKRSWSSAFSTTLLIAVIQTASPALPAVAAQGADDPSVDVTFSPEVPVQGRLFVVRVRPGDGPGVARIRGSAGDEELHFFTTDQGTFESLAPAPIDAEGAVAVSMTVEYADGTAQVVDREVPVAAGDYRHEQLTVAPRFGSPLDSADAAHLDRDRAKAREVSRQAHLTPRIWTPVVTIPRDDRVTSGFGNGREFNGQISSRHMGLDLDGEPGDTVVAVTRGVVELVDAFLLAGNIVYINHGGGLLSGYFHLSEQLVQPGDTVEAGTPVGRVGATGRVTGPHLHWVVRYGSTSVDPRSLLEVGR